MENETSERAKIDLSRFYIPMRGGKTYLTVAGRLVWFRAEHPDWTIETTITHIKDDFAIVRAVISDATGRVIASAHKREDKAHFADNLEKAETGAVGRALMLCGYGTDSAPELDEGERIVDSPQPRRNQNGNGGRF